MMVAMTGLCGGRAVVAVQKVGSGKFGGGEVESVVHFTAPTTLESIL